MPSLLPFRTALFIVCGHSLCVAAPLRAAQTAPEPIAPRPRMEITATQQDGGVVEQGTLVQFQFPLRNRGQADLEIREVRTSCGCSVARWDRVVKPGGA